mgnify:FL=1
MNKKEANKMTIDNMSVQSLHKALNSGGYICSPTFSAQLTTAIKTKPVGGAFLYGLAGTGKSFLPHVLSEVLKRPLYSYQCTQTLQPEDLLIKPMPDGDAPAGISIMPSVLLKASQKSHEEEVIVMLDEWDKTRPGADGFLLDFFQYGRLSIPGMDVDANLDNMLIFITANDDRPFHEALLRRFPKLDVKPMKPTDVLKALSLTHEEHPYMSQMIDLYCRSIDGGLPKPATIQELRQLMDAITELGDGADWDMLVYQYVTKTPESHEILNSTQKVDVEHYDRNFDKKATIDADDYGVEVKSNESEEILSKMPTLRPITNIKVADSTDIDTDEVFGVFKTSEKMISELLSMEIDSEEPDDSAILDWGAITKDVTFVKNPFYSSSVHYVKRKFSSSSHEGEIKFVDEYITRKELSRLLAGKGWFIQKRDKNEIIARKYYRRGKVDLRYIESQGLEIIADAKITELIDIFRFNSDENLVHNIVYVNATNKTDSEVPINDIYEPSNLVAGQMNKVIDERRYVTFGSSQIKRLSEHESFCRMTVLRAPTGAGSCGDNEFDISKLSTLMYTEPYPYGHRNIHLTAKNVEFALSDLCGTNGTMWLKIDGFVKGNILIELFNWFNFIPLYRCFRFYDTNLFNKLLKAGWTPINRNNHCLYKDGIYARFVYDYVVFTALVSGNDCYDEQGAEVIFKTKLNRIKQLEKRYSNNT